MVGLVMPDFVRLVMVSVLVREQEDFDLLHTPLAPSSLEVISEDREADALLLLLLADAIEDAAINERMATLRIMILCVVANHCCIGIIYTLQ